MLNFGFNNFERVKVAFKGQFIDNINVNNGTIPVVAGILEKDLFSTLPNNSLENISTKVTFKEDINAPIKKGDMLGKIEYFFSDEYIGTVNIVSTLDIDEIPSPTFFDKLLDIWYLILFFGFIIPRFLITYNKRKKRRRRYSYYKSRSYYK